MVTILHGAKGDVLVPRGIPGQRMWTRPFFNAFVKKCEEVQVPLNPTYIKKHCPTAFTVGADIYGSWEIALRRNHIKYENVILVKRPMQKNEIKKAIANRETHGQSLLISAVQREDYRLWYSGEAQYGSWERALTANGRNYAEIKKKEMEARMTKTGRVVSAARLTSIKEEVRSEIKRRAQAELPITRWFVERDDIKLFKKGKLAYHDSWKAAVADAGIDYKEALLREWPDDAIKTELHNMQEGQKWINISDAIAVFSVNPDIYIAAITRHKKWKLALAAYGSDIYRPKPVLPSRYNSLGLERTATELLEEFKKANKR
jgi:hypothetical protein